MNFEAIREHLLSLPHATEDFPFDETTLVFRVGNKIFAIVPLDEELAQVNLKCDPERAVELREQYRCVRPGFHMNKTHWNTLYMHDDATWGLFLDLAIHSYELIYHKLPRKVKEQLANGQS